MPHCRIVWAMARAILARTARATTGLGQAGIFDFIVGASIPVEDW